MLWSNSACSYHPSLEQDFNPASKPSRQGGPPLFSLTHTHKGEQTGLPRSLDDCHSPPVILPDTRANTILYSYDWECGNPIGRTRPAFFLYFFGPLLFSPLSLSFVLCNCLSGSFACLAALTHGRWEETRSAKTPTSGPGPSKRTRVLWWPWAKLCLTDVLSQSS